MNNSNILGFYSTNILKYCCKNITLKALFLANFTEKQAFFEVDQVTGFDKTPLSLIYKLKE